MLTIKQERFVQELIKGKSQIEAYKNSYDASRMKDATIYVKASKLFKMDKIRIRYEELMKEAQASAVMDATQMRAFIIEQLTLIATGQGQDTSEVYDGDGHLVQSRRGSRQTDRVNALNKLADIYGITEAEKDNNVTVVFATSDEVEDYAN